MIPELRTACMVCESGAVIERYKHVVFADGTLRAFNGVVHVQAPSSLDPILRFAVNEERLLQALSACESEDVEIKNTSDFLVMKHGKLTVRIRKISADTIYHDAITGPPRAQQHKVPEFQEVLRAVAPFMSADASRPWTTSILFRGGFAWATNNLSLVKYPMVSQIPSQFTVPSAAVPVLCNLSSIDWIYVDGNAQVIVGCGKLKVAFPQASAAWPANVADYFDKAPKKLPKLDAELLAAAKIVEKFAERFVSLRPEKVEGKLATIESEYEIEVPNGKGIYPAKLLLLVLTHATHADFSTYPEPIFFAGEKLRGVAVGAKEP